MAVRKSSGRSDDSVSSRSRTGGGKTAPLTKSGGVRGGDGELSKRAVAQVSEKLGIPVDRVYRMVETIEQVAHETGDTDKIVEQYKNDKSALIQILLEIQRENRWLPRNTLTTVCEKLGVPLSNAYRIATFYKAFSLVPKGRHGVSVCLGTACHVRGAPRLLDRVKTALDIEAGETSPDMKFSLETVNCLGCCALGPVIVVDGDYHSNPSTTELEKIVSACD